MQEDSNGGKQVGLGAGMFGGAGVFVVYALGALTACAGALALMGKGRIEKGAPPVPEQAIESVKEDVEWTKSRANAAER